jgi:hypothetical protein
MFNNHGVSGKKVMSSKFLSLDEVMQSMIDAIPDLDLLRHHPDDLLLYDRRILEKALVPNLTLGWVVGHTHSHLLAFGVHPEENALARCLTQLSVNDRFYRLQDLGTGRFDLDLIDKDAFIALGDEAICYQKNGPDRQFEVYRHTCLIGFVSVAENTPGAKKQLIASITPAFSASKADCVALRYWAEKACAKLAGVLVYEPEVIWFDPYVYRQVA